MRWRSALGLLVGALIPVPLVLALALPGGWAGHADTGNLSPMLSWEARRQLLTYHRFCQKSDDCEPPQGCLHYWRLVHPHCTDSECRSDADCREGEACQVLETEGHGPRVRLCVAQGVRREGEQCMDLPQDGKEACAPQLRCSAGWCGRPCHLDAPTSCPEGFFCGDGGEGPVCLPTCEARGCPEGQKCLRFNTVGGRPVSSCVRVHGPDCQRSPCQDGQECNELDVPEYPGEAWMECRVNCEHDPSICPEGLRCHRYYCRQPCDPHVPGVCGPDRTCIQFDDGEPFFCRLGR